MKQKYSLLIRTAAISSSFFCKFLASSFLIGDNDIYEGTGWHIRGAHTFGFNSNATGIAFIGSFNGKTVLS